ncbi:hypothetical protein FV139_12680 [Parahaliea maris]|uniref:Uncharacterized protein n=1 Tax=Parahaliea maris TaxID=2716870 RepID=A0A5C8ZYE6_9GAMM|nr:hypothetical protein [Parahaliea maris]TXS92819.1 hypothetical protein FV139_12680 [Parahaliea maris]
MLIKQGGVVLSVFHAVAAGVAPELSERCAPLGSFLAQQKNKSNKNNELRGFSLEDFGKNNVTYSFVSHIGYKKSGNMLPYTNEERLTSSNVAICSYLASGQFYREAFFFQF